MHHDNVALLTPNVSRVFLYVNHYRGEIDESVKSVTV